MYLSKIAISNYKGIEKLEIDFDPNINIIIGENGCCKSAVIDAIRLLYNIGEPVREINVARDDFHEKVQEKDGVIEIVKSTLISITYEFKGLTPTQKGAFYEYMVIDPQDDKNDYAKITLRYEQKDGRYPQFSYTTGNLDGQKADYKTFELFQHYYLGALRDSTKDLLNTRGNIMGRVIKRFIDRKKSEKEIEKIVKEANDQLLQRDEITNTRDGVNKNLQGIFKNFPDNIIGIEIEQAKAEFIVNAVKPFLPHNKTTLKDDGFHLWQNSLGFNNLIYIATVLGDIREQTIDNNVPHYALLIEEPEAHLHPQLQLSLYSFLKKANSSENSQLFITTHSPTLTSKVPLKHLVLLDKQKAFRLSNLFIERETENIIIDTVTGEKLTAEEAEYKRKQLERYIDVTKSQLFYAKAILFVEGISEELLISAFTLVEDYELEDYRIELVNVRGTSFYPFIYLFNSSNKQKQITKPITILTDDDRFTDSKDKKYSFDELIKNNYALLDELYTNIKNGTPSSRCANIMSTVNSATNIKMKSAFKTLEFELALSNVNTDRKTLKDNFLVSYIDDCIDSRKITKVVEYTQTFADDNMTDEQKAKVAILLWKCLPSKADFAQEFSIALIEDIETAKKAFNVPLYIKEGLENLKKPNGI